MGSTDRKDRSVDGLDVKDERLLDAYLATGSLPEAAGVVGMDRTTAWRRAGEATFREELNRRLGEERARAEAALRARHEAAWKAMDRALGSENEAISLRAATWTLERIMASKDATQPPSTVDAELEKTRMTLLKALRSDVKEP